MIARWGEGALVMIARWGGGGLSQDSEGRERGPWS